MSSLMLVISLAACLLLADTAAGGVDETKSLQARLDAAAAEGGGVVTVPVGSHVVGGLRLRSNVELHLDEGATLVFTDDLEDRLPPVRSSYSGIECLTYSPLVYAFGVTNVAITGKGTLTARTALWESWTNWDWKHRPPENIASFATLYRWGENDVPVEARDTTRYCSRTMRPVFIQFNRCRGVRLEGVRIRNPPCWTVHLLHSEDVVIRGLDLFGRLKNSDGIDVEATRNVLIENCRLDQRDDGFVIKSGRDRDGRRRSVPTENVEIRNCHVAGAITLLGIGSEVSGGVSNVWMHDCSADVCSSRALQLKTSRRKGAYIKDIRIENIVCGEAPIGFGIDTDVEYQYRPFPASATNMPTLIENVTVRNFRIRKVRDFLRILGDADRPVRSLRIEDCEAEAVSGEPLVCENAELTLANCRVTGKGLLEMTPQVNHTRKDEH